MLPDGWMQTSAVPSVSLVKGDTLIRNVNLGETQQQATPATPAPRPRAAAAALPVLASALNRHRLGSGL